MTLKGDAKLKYQKEYMQRRRASKGLTIEGSNIVWEKGGYRGEYIDGVFCVNGKPYEIGDILDLSHAPYRFIDRLYKMTRP